MKSRIIANRSNTLRDKYDIPGRSQPSFCKWRVWATCLPKLWEGELTISPSILRWMIWPEEEQRDSFHSRRGPPGGDTLLYPCCWSQRCNLLGHRSGCNEKLLSAPALWSSPRSHQGLTRLLRYIPLRQSLGHLETRFAVLLSLAVHVTVKWHTAKISGHALAAHCEDPQEMPEVSPRL